MDGQQAESGMGQAGGGLSEGRVSSALFLWAGPEEGPQRPLSLPPVSVDTFAVGPQRTLVQTPCRRGRHLGMQPPNSTAPFMGRFPSPR